MHANTVPVKPTENVTHDLRRRRLIHEFIIAHLIEHSIERVRAVRRGAILSARRSVVSLSSDWFPLVTTSSSSASTSSRASTRAVNAGRKYNSDSSRAVAVRSTTRYLPSRAHLVRDRVFRHDPRHDASRAALGVVQRPHAHGDENFIGVVVDGAHGVESRVRATRAVRCDATIRFLSAPEPRRLAIVLNE